MYEPVTIQQLRREAEYLLPESPAPSSEATEPEPTSEPEPTPSETPAAVAAFLEAQA